MCTFVFDYRCRKDVRITLDRRRLLMKKAKVIFKMFAHTNVSYVDTLIRYQRDTGAADLPLYQVQLNFSLSAEPS